MKPHWKQRLAEWVCGKVGHKHDIADVWFHDAKAHCACDRCHHIISRDKASKS